MSKGSTRRPQQVSNKEFAERWAAIWGDGPQYCKHGYIPANCKFCTPPTEDNPYKKHFEEME